MLHDVLKKRTLCAKLVQQTNCTHKHYGDFDILSIGAEPSETKFNFCPERWTVKDFSCYRTRPEWYRSFWLKNRYQCYRTSPICRTCLPGLFSLPAFQKVRERGAVWWPGGHANERGSIITMVVWATRCTYVGGRKTERLLCKTLEALMNSNYYFSIFNRLCQLTG